MTETGKSATVVQKDLANALMHCGDVIPPHLYDQRILRDVKSDYVRELHLHQMAMTALVMMKSGEFKNSIHSIGADPFFIFYSSVQQLHVYMAYCRVNGIDVQVSLDATGGIVQKIARPDGTISGHVFLYECVILWENHQFTVNQMLSEKHDALHIANWLRHWRKLGAPTPKELVTDDGKALIIAGINTFTRYQTITEYANACFLKKKIPCYIRIDVAHFIHKYAILLKNVQSLVKKLFLVAIGQLILSRSEEEAGKILRCILVICQSSTTGFSKGNSTECSRSIDRIKDMVIHNRHEDIDENIEKAIEGKFYNSKTLP